MQATSAWQRSDRIPAEKGTYKITSTLNVRRGSGYVFGGSSYSTGLKWGRRVGRHSWYRCRTRRE